MSSEFWDQRAKPNKSEPKRIESTPKHAKARQSTPKCLSPPAFACPRASRLSPGLKLRERLKRDGFS